MKKHEWREKLEDGETRLVTATRHAGKWQLQSRLKSEDEWTKFEKIELEDLETLLGIIERKYQRCLLYTSPSPRDQRGSRMPSSA